VSSVCKGCAHPECSAWRLNGERALIQVCPFIGCACNPPLERVARQPALVSETMSCADCILCAAGSSDLLFCLHPDAPDGAANNVEHAMMRQRTPEWCPLRTRDLLIRPRSTK
jgi:hypothetical protein